MSEFAWSDGTAMTQAEERCIRELATGERQAMPLPVVQHLHALKVIAPHDPALPTHLTGLGRIIAVQYLGVRLVERRGA
jgi:hypothetical protein